jgi:hypothetical protein
MWAMSFGISASDWIESATGRRWLHLRVQHVDPLA